MGHQLTSTPRLGQELERDLQAEVEEDGQRGVTSEEEMVRDRARKVVLSQCEDVLQSHQANPKRRTLHWKKKRKI